MGKQIVSLILNLSVVVVEIIATVWSLCLLGLGGSAIYYTQNSNFLGLIACALVAIFQIRAIKTGKPIPNPIRILKFLASCCLMITFLVVITILGPMLGGAKAYVFLMLQGVCFLLHFLGPVLTVVSYLFFERARALPFRTTFLAIAPTAVYGAVLVPLNLVGVVDGPYPFLKPTQQPIWVSILWCIVLFLISWIVGILVWRINRPRKNKETAGNHFSFSP